MLYTRAYRNNWGYQINVERRHPIWKYDLGRLNKNEYKRDSMYGHKIVIDNVGGRKGVQFGGANKKNISDEVYTGSGVDPKVVLQAAQMLYTGAKKIGEFYSSETGTAIKNTYGKWMNADVNWAPGFPGEKHLITRKGVTMNFAGPGTRLKERLARGDMPVGGPNSIDAAAKLHDIAYARARSWEDVRKADRKFLKDVDQSTAGTLSKKFVKGLFKAKMIGEDVGLVKPSDFTSFPNIQDEKPPKLEEKQQNPEVVGETPRSCKKIKEKIKKI